MPSSLLGNSLLPSVQQKSKQSRSSHLDRSIANKAGAAQKRVGELERARREAEEALAAAKESVASMEHRVAAAEGAAQRAARMSPSDSSILENGPLKLEAIIKLGALIYFESPWARL